VPKLLKFVLETYIDHKASVARAVPLSDNGVGSILPAGTAADLEFAAPDYEKKFPLATLT